MNVLQPLLLLFLASLAGSQGPYTYWVDQSCRQRSGTHFEVAFRDMQRWAARAATRLRDPSDPVQHDYFTQLFMPPEDLNYGYNVWQVARILWSISSMILVPGNNRLRANFRYYCDNDPVETSVNSNTRWKIKDDPPRPHPEDYRPQLSRRAYSDPQRRAGEPWQELQDDDNEIETDGDDLCGYHEPELLTRAITYSGKKPQSSKDQPDIRATVTICDRQLSGRIPSLGSIDNDMMLSALRPIEVVGQASAMNNFLSITAAVLLHEALHLPPHSYDDQDSPLYPGELAYGWYNAIFLRPTKKVRNPDNFVLFALLARLADRGYKLADSFHGTLERDPSLILPFSKRNDDRNNTDLWTLHEK